MFEIKECSDYEIARSLFIEYSKLKGAEQCFVSFENELKDIELIYPVGQLLLAFENGNPVGCIAFKNLDGKECEIKRLYIKEEYRGKGYSKLLFERILENAHNLGYEKAIIRTLPEIMKVGYHMYLKYGFIKSIEDEDQVVTLTKMYRK